MKVALGNHFHNLTDKNPRQTAKIVISKIITEVWWKDCERQPRDNLYPFLVGGGGDCNSAVSWWNAILIKLTGTLYHSLYVTIILLTISLPHHCKVFKNIVHFNVAHKFIPYLRHWQVSVIHIKQTQCYTRILACFYSYSPHWNDLTHTYVFFFFIHNLKKLQHSWLMTYTAQHHLTCHTHVACTIQCTKLIQTLDIYKEYTVSLSAKKSQRNIHNNMTLHCPLFHSVAVFTFSLLHVSLPVL